MFIIFILTIIVNILKLVNDENDNFLIRVDEENLLRNNDNRGNIYIDDLKQIISFLYCMNATQNMIS